jgi:sporulation protein YlmC with PRC-barrel domain
VDRLTPDQLGALVGREVVDDSGESVGYVDVLFRDEETGGIEWLGLWNGVWGTKPRVLVPVEGVQTTGDDRLQLRWSKGHVEGAPTYDEEDDRGLFSDDPVAIGIAPVKEQAAYAHYGLEAGERGRAGGAETARLRAAPRNVSDPPATAG